MRVERAGARALADWIVAHGGRVGALEVRGYADGQRGVHARSGLAAGELPLVVPRRCLITVEAARASETGRKIAAAGLADASDHSFLAVHLLEQRSEPRSPIRPYLDSLPRSYRHMPLFFGPRELGLLKGSFTVDEIRLRRAALVAQRRALTARVPELRRFSLDQFVWGRLAALTRVFALTIDGVQTEALVPFADLLNHKQPCETSWAYDARAAGFVLGTLSPIAPGTPVHDSYGSKCNSRFFINYGFCLEDNTANEAALWMTPPRWSGAVAARARDLGEGVDGMRLFRFSCDPAAASTRDLFSFLRLACADERDLRGLPGRGPIPPLGRRNEDAVRRVLATACTRALARFDTTLDEDAALLRDPSLSPSTRNCILMRRGEKQVLATWIARANANAHANAHVAGA